MPKEVIQLSNLQAVVEYLHTHGLFKSSTHVDIWKLLRQTDGTHMAIEEMKGARLNELRILPDNIMILDHHISGRYGAGKPYTSHCRTYLNQIIFINIYEFSIDFLSISDLDITIIYNENKKKLSLLESYMMGIQPDMVAQWSNDIGGDRLMNMTFDAPKYRVAAKHTGRNFDI